MKPRPKTLKPLALFALTLATTTPAPAIMHQEHDPPQAAVAWSNPDHIAVGASYARLARPLDLPAHPSLQADAFDLMIGWQPTAWFLLFAHGGASQAKIKEHDIHPSDFGAGGGIGAKLNLFQIDEGQDSAWRFMLKLEARYTYRTTSGNNCNGKFQWGEAWAAIPLTYALHFSKRARVGYRDEFYSLELFGGPALSKVNGTWKQNNLHTHFEEDDLLGAFAGGELWLFQNFCIGGRAEYFGKTGFSAYVQYNF